MTTANKYREHYIDAAFVPPSGVTGTYFNGSAYLFYQMVGDTPQRFIRYTKVRVKEDESLKVLASDQVLSSQDYTLLSENTSIAACVYANVMYVFWQDTNGTVHYQRKLPSTEEQEWISRTEISGFRVDPDTQLAAVSVGDRLYILGSLWQNNTHKLNIAYTEDGNTWFVELSPNWINVKSVSACSYLDTNGDSHLLFGMASRNNNVWTGRYKYEPNGRGSKLVLIDTKEHTELRGRCDFIALATGSTEGGANGNVVQMFINGKHGSTWIGWQYNQKKEYRVEADQWEPSQVRTLGDTQYPTWYHMGAFQFFRSRSQGELQQELWNVMVYNKTNLNSYLYVARWKSDSLKLVKAEEQSVSDSLKALVGVVEGPPPYILNGDSFKRNVSSFQYGWSDTRQASIAMTFKYGFYFRWGGKMPLQADEKSPLKLPYDCKLAFEQSQTATDSQELTIAVNKTIFPVAGKNQTTYLWLRPIVIRHTYDILDWSGEPINGGQTVIFSTSQVGLDFDVRDNLSQFPGSPNTHDFHSWYQRFTMLPSYADASEGQFLNMPVTWVENGDTEFTFQRKVTSMNYRTTTVSVDAKAGLDGIFDLGGNLSFSYNVVHKTEFSEKIGFKLAYPISRPDHPEDIVKVVLRALVFNPDEGAIDKCYWIPKDKQSHRPWCVAWSVDEFMTQHDLTERMGTDLMAESFLSMIDSEGLVRADGLQQHS